MIAYRTPSNQLNQYRLILGNAKHIKYESIATTQFDPLKMLDIFEHGRQIKVVERAINIDITNYLKVAAPKLGKGFQYIIKANEAISERLIKDSGLPNYQGRDEFLADLDYIANLYTDLLGCPTIGIRLEILNQAMCPKFHVDKTGIRLLCTYTGPGTEWLEDAYADRTKLGMASANMDDAVSGVVLDAKGIQQVPLFAVALLKGSLWQGNGMHGIIHRSPAVTDSKPRVMLAIDAIW